MNGRQQELSGVTGLINKINVDFNRKGHALSPGNSECRQWDSVVSNDSAMGRSNEVGGIQLKGVGSIRQPT